MPSPRRRDAVPPPPPPPPPPPLLLLVMVMLVVVVPASPAGVVRGRSRPLADALAAGVGRLWWPRPRRDPSRGPDRTDIILSVNTDPSRLDGGLEFEQQRRQYRQPTRRFSVFNRAAGARAAGDSQPRTSQERPRLQGRLSRRQERRWARPTERLSSRRKGRLVKTCGGHITVNNTYFVNENYPAPYDGAGSCQIRIDKVNDNICQFRLDFDSLTLAPPEPLNHICTQDRFYVMGSTSTPLICGTSSGNHMYLDAASGAASSGTTLNIVTSGPSFARSWKIRVSQIPCGATYAAEPTCLQYHTGVQGVVRSYNFDFNTGTGLANQDFTVCVRTERNFCGIKYTPCKDPGGNSSRAFSLGGGPVGALTGAPCTGDWISAPCLTGFVTPFRLTYLSDSAEAVSSTSESTNHGFCLDYVQQPCSA